MAATQRQTRGGGQDKLQAALKALEQGVERIIDGEEFRRYLTMMARFHSYSSNNVLLILMQRPDATAVAGYKRWQQLGRQVKRGEKGIGILAPLSRKVSDDTDDSTRVITGFRVATVFAFEQTEGDPLPEPPAVEAITRASDKGAELFRRLERWLITEGVTVEVGYCGEANGFYQPGARRIVLSREITGSDHAVKTLCHEAAHHVAGHRGYMPRDASETVAEATAYCVLSHYGIDTCGYSFGYVAAWAQDIETLKGNLEGIRKTAHHIIEALEASQDDRMCHSACAEKPVAAL